MKSFIPNFFLRWPGELFERLLAMPLFKGLGAPFTVQAVKLICAIGAVALIFLDVLLLDDGIAGNTWSELMRTYGRAQWVLPWLCGVLIGHLFHQADEAQPAGNLTAPEAYNAMFWLTVIVLIIGSALSVSGGAVPEVAMTLVAALGCAAGYALWPLNRKENGPPWEW